MNLIKKKVALPLIIILFLFTFQTANADIVPCGDGNNPADACTLCHLVIGIHAIVTWGRNVLISVAALGIVVSGIMYMISSGSEEMISKAKGFLKASLTGFIVTLMAWFFVNTVMWIISAKGDLGTGLTNINWYTFTCSTATGASLTPTSTSPVVLPAGTLTDSEARQILSSAGISIVSSGNCNDQNNPTCTSLQGIPERTITNLTAIRNFCNLPMTITGGTETGHQSHGTGLTPVDLSWNANLAGCVYNNASTFNVNRICTAPQDSQYRISCTYNEPNQHIHVSFI